MAADDRVRCGWEWEQDDAEEFVHLTTDGKHTCVVMVWPEMGHKCEHQCACGADTAEVTG